jgi:hypothetical protein
MNECWSHSIYLNDGEFRELKCAVEKCLSHIVGGRASTIVSNSNSGTSSASITPLNRQPSSHLAHNSFSMLSSSAQAQQPASAYQNLFLMHQNSLPVDLNKSETAMKVIKLLFYFTFTFLVEYFMVILYFRVN